MHNCVLSCSALSYLMISCTVYFYPTVPSPQVFFVASWWQDSTRPSISNSLKPRHGTFSSSSSKISVLPALVGSLPATDISTLDGSSWTREGSFYRLQKQSTGPYPGGPFNGWAVMFTREQKFLIWTYWRQSTGIRYYHMPPGPLHNPEILCEDNVHLNRLVFGSQFPLISTNFSQSVFNYTCRCGYFNF